MTVFTNLRYVIAASLVAVMPLQSVSAATRPVAAIPAAVTSVSAQDDGRDDSRGRAGWALPAVGVILAAIILAIVLERNNGRGRGTGFSR